MPLSCRSLRSLDNVPGLRRTMLCLKASALAAGLAVTPMVAVAADPPATASPDMPAAVDTTAPVVVRNDERGLWERGGGLWREDPRWTLREEFRIGAIDGRPEELFGHVTRIGLSPDGGIHVIDFQSQEVRAFNADGSFRALIGGQGQGPGEFDGALSLAWDGAGRLWVPDGWNRRYSVFEPSGRLVRTIPRELAATGWSQVLVYEGRGTFIDETAVEGIPSPGVVGLVRVDTSGIVIDSFPPLERPAFTLGDLTQVERLRIPRELGDFRPRLEYNVSADGYVWFATSDEYRLYQRTLAGDTVRIIETSHRPLPLSRAENRRIDRYLSDAGLDRSNLAVGRQIIRGIHILDDGHLLVHIEEVAGEDSGTFDVFDRNGRFLGTVTTPFAVDSRANLAVRGDALIAVTRGEMDEHYIVRARLTRP